FPPISFLSERLNLLKARKEDNVLKPSSIGGTEESSEEERRVEMCLWDGGVKEL
ncbi:hypothetical protein A2U01_0109496, partial [Trifolium medium]|nr:hypothetical protein [Trifolium medium]